jgi:hypothetical protein
MIFLITCKQNQKEAKNSVTPITACILSEIVYCNHPKDSLNKYLPGWTIVWNPAEGLEIKNANSVYTQTNGNGNLTRVNLSGKNITNDAAGWFAEAGYQHSIEQYAANIGAPVIVCR